jgi:hypothetical protein
MYRLLKNKGKLNPKGTCGYIVLYILTTATAMLLFCGTK